MKLLRVLEDPGLEIPRFVNLLVLTYRLWIEGSTSLAIAQNHVKQMVSSSDDRHVLSMSQLRAPVPKAQPCNAYSNFHGKNHVDQGYTPHVPRPVPTLRIQIRSIGRKVAQERRHQMLVYVQRYLPYI